MILHTVNKSPLNSDCLASCLRIADSNDSILLIEDGVYAATAHFSALFDQNKESVHLYALKADVEARGLLDQLAQSCTLVDDEGFVKLSTSCHKVQSWY